MMKFIWPRLGKEEKRAIVQQLDKSISIYDRSGIIEELEINLQKYFDVKHALLTNSGTNALFSLYVGIGLQKGDEVICPAYTFYATVTPLLFTGAIPVLVDCDENGNIDPSEIEAKINPRTKAIMITHMWGVPCKMNEIMKIARKNNLILLEDGSHAHGARYGTKLIGTFGDASAFSMQGQKTLTGGEGGFILTNNDEIYYRCLLLGHYNKRCKQEIPKHNKYSKFSVTGMGLKFRIHPLASAIANEQLKKIDNFLSGRNKTAKFLLEQLGHLKGIRVPDIAKNMTCSWYAFIIKFVPEELDGVKIEEFHEYLLNNNCPDADIPKSTCPLNLLPLFQEPEFLFPEYKDKFSYKKGDFPNAEKFYNSIIKIPVWDKEEDLSIAKHYVSVIKQFLKEHGGG